MDSSEARLDIIEAQRSPDVSHDQGKRRYFPINLIKRTISLLGFLVGEGTSTAKGETKSVPDFLTNLRLSDFFSFPGVYVPMSPEVSSTVSAGKKDWREKVRSYGKPMACLRSDQGDSVLHLAAARGLLELVKTIVSECPCLLMERNCKDQLPLHVAARAGHLAVVEALVATVTFVSGRFSEEERESVNQYAVKDINEDTPLHLALKDRNWKIAACLVKANQKASFLANKDGKSPLYLAVETGELSIVKEMLKTRDNNDGLEEKKSNIDSQLQGRKCLVQAALEAMNTDILDFILKEDPSLEDERDEGGMTCLSYAISIGYYKGVCKLLSRSTKSVYVANKDGSFPIHIAVERNQKRVIMVLLKCCPDSLELLNKQGQNILHIAAKNGKATFAVFYPLRQTSLKNQMMEVQDVDGNTPLHLAAIEWRPRTVFDLLSRHKGKRLLYTRNNSGLTALDIAESTLHPYYIFLERVTLAVLLYFYAYGSRDDTWTIIKGLKGITIPSEPPAGNKNKDYVNTLLVVAALVATVTFAAGFTIPGGFNPPDPNKVKADPNLGRAVLATDLKLVFFMVFDILAMQSSIVTIATLIWAQLGDRALVHKSLVVALPSLFLALICMPVAFYCGVFVSFAHVEGLVIFLNFTSVIFLFVMLFILGPHVFLQIPGIPAFFGAYFWLFLLLIDEDSEKQASAVIVEKEESAVKSSDMVNVEKEKST